MNHPTVNLISTSNLQEQLIKLVSPCILALGYQTVHLELQSHQQKTLRIYIDFVDPTLEKKGIGIEDCVKVSKALDEFLDLLPEAQALLPSAYELEVSSPGVDRPLRTANDFERFAGNEVRIHTFRSLTNEEMGNPGYHDKNPRQKNFLGTLVGLKEGKVVLSFSSKDNLGSGKKSKALKKAKLDTNSVEGVQILIPLPLISKANLEPHFDFEASDEREQLL